jgi:peptidyl-prolyl cis-trans isomerase C
MQTQSTLSQLQAAAVQAGLLDAAEELPTGGVATQAAATAIEAWLERELDVREPDEAACRRHHAAHAARFGHGERARLRHVLFAVTPGVDVAALRQRAEACLIELRAHAKADDAHAAFAQAAHQWSNCPSGAAGGELGWLGAEDCAPEFARDVFLGHAEVGVLPRLVHSRFGLHVVEVLERQPGVVPPFEEAREAVAQALRQQAYINAVRILLQRLSVDLHRVP